ncbi:MAG: hypothetical protein IJQ43_05645, partial [Oscillospiraceae bacterium]|nr:hypothetical protein [Oscillospiraceae bacterium]
SFVSLATTFLCCASKSHLALALLLLLSKTKPHGRFMPRRQLRHYAVRGFVFANYGNEHAKQKARESVQSVPRAHDDPLRSIRRRKLRIACDDFFMLA